MSVITGDCVEAMREMEPNSIDAIVTDPPAGISFMSKSWDSDKGGRDAWIAWLTEVMRECYRVLKPGGHALIWALPRTSHWTALAVEDAGFEIRDRIQHLFGSGFPKSANVSKAIDKAAGATREVVGPSPIHSRGSNTAFPKVPGATEQAAPQNAPMLTAPATPEAAQWDGWGTALKPATEDWWLARKPLSEPTVAANVLRWGTGALNIDAGRIGTESRPHIERRNDKALDGDVYGSGINGSRSLGTFTAGRWPANVILSHSLWCVDDACDESCPVRLLDAQSGNRPGMPRTTARTGLSPKGYGIGVAPDDAQQSPGYGDIGGASRFFKTIAYSPDEVTRFRYQAKAPRSERVLSNHPTQKPVALMRYLVQLVTPPGGVVLDPFAGSGTTLVACAQLGFACIGIEKEPDYVAIIERRLQHAKEAA